MNDLTLALWQTAYAPTTAEALHRLDATAEQARAQGAELLITPEMVLTGYAIGADRVAALAEPSDGPLTQAVAAIAQRHGIAIVYGYPEHHPGGKPFNAAQAIAPDGTRLMAYRKTHLFGDLDRAQFSAGDTASQVFTWRGWKLGLLICYDVEFPELSRLMAQDGMQILFVPFMTDTQNAYSRVRVCAQARAIENECYVAIAGSVGNLPRVHNMDIQYAQSAVFTPCDFAFPNDGKRSEATPNTEMILVSDVDLNLLNELHTYGAVRNLRDRRKDLYELKKK